jgi:hypothetical protein
MEILTSDIEIIKAIPVGDKLEGIEYCTGWTDYKGMGIAVIGYQWNDEPPAFALDANTFASVLMERKEPIFMGFNSLKFDDKLLQANGVEITTTYDLLVEVRKAAGYTSRSQVPKGYSYKLDAIAKANGKAKTGEGALAPVLWQQGKRQQVIDYCINDVVITKAMLNLGLAGQLIDPNTGAFLQLAMPVIETQLALQL